jgi:hypothetical protein
MNSSDVGAWSGNWAWSLPLIVINVLLHVSSLALLNDTLDRILLHAMRREA